jgi:hypothetical protein
MSCGPLLHSPKHGREPRCPFGEVVGMRVMNLKILLGLGVIAMASPAAASVVEYTSQAAFNAAASGVSTFTFDQGNIPPLSTFQPNPVTFNGVTFEDLPTPANAISGGSPGLILISASATPTYGQDFLAFQNEDPSILGTISSAGATAFGFTFGSYVNVGSSATLTLNTGEIFTVTPGTTAQFIGFTSDAPITSISLDYDNSFTFDVLSVSSNLASVPEPASWTLMLLGFGGLGAVMRRRRLAIV